MANNEQSGKSKKAPVSQRLKGVVRMERPWFIVFGVALLLASALAAVSMYQLSSEPAAIQADADTQAARKDVSTTPGGNATQAYREKMQEYNKRQAEEASEGGSTHVPPVLAGDNSSNGKQQDSQSIQKDNQNESSDTAVERERQAQKDNAGEQSQSSPRIEALQNQIRQMQNQMRRMSAQMRRQQETSSNDRNRQTQQVRQEKMSRYRDQLASLTSELQAETVEQKVKTFESVSPQQTGAGEQQGQAGASQSPGDSTGQSSSGQSAGDDEGGSGLAINSGDILYARNEMQLNSDVGGPAQATILSGEYRGSKLLGGFEKKENYLRVEFGRLVTPEGKQYSIQAYAINPEVSSTAVRSDVDRHMLQRWGGLMAASFLAGFGEAVSQGGTSVSVSDGTTTKGYPELDMNQQLWSAGGKVGETLASKFEENFSRPSTVTLRSGQKLGILVLSTEN